jgi:hypothetical protein
MANQGCRTAPARVAVALSMVVALLNGCVGSGSGLDANGNPIGSAPGSAPGSEPLTADFQSIQDNVFTPICTRCHSGAGAPEGLQLDAAHSYALLVGVPSAEVPSVLRVKPGDPTDSYLIQKLQNSSGIVGAQMPFGGPYLPQSTIDVIQQWISAGAPPPATAAAAAALAVTATMPVDRTAMTAPVTTIAVGLNQEPDVSFLNEAVRLQNISAEPVDIPVLIARAEGNPATVLLTPVAPLLPGAYRVTLRGGGASALTAVGGESLPADYSFTFTVDKP